MTGATAMELCELIMPVLLVILQLEIILLARILRRR